MSRDGNGELAEFYRSAYARLVAVVGAVSQDRDLAEEAVQDAFVQLVGAWARVRDYEDPEAWARRVAFGYVSKRRRKARNGLRAVALHGVAPHAPALSANAVDVQRALAAIPRQQREVIVLQHLGFGVEEIAAQLRVPSGTVKSRLSRARTALATLLREEENDHA